MVVKFSTYLRSHYQSFSTIYFGAWEWNTDMYPLGLYILHKICFTMKHFNHRSVKDMIWHNLFHTIIFTCFLDGACPEFHNLLFFRFSFIICIDGINYERVKKNYKDRFSKRYIKSFGKNEKPYMINLLHHQTSDPSLHRQNRKK